LHPESKTRQRNEKNEQRVFNNKNEASADTLSTDSAWLGACKRQADKDIIVYDRYDYKHVE